MFRYSLIAFWLVKARPACPRFIFGRCFEQFLAATNTSEGAAAFLGEMRSRTSALCPVLARDMILFRGELSSPFGVTLGDFWHAFLTLLVNYAFMGFTLPTNMK